MIWKVYYPNGVSFTNEQGDAYHVPQCDVQAVNNNGKLQYGKEAYYWKPELGWCGCDMPGLWDYLLMYRGPKAVLFGRLIRDEDFWAIIKQAKAEN